MKKNYLYYFTTILFMMGFGKLSAQVSLTATSGTTVGSYATLKATFDAINAGTHTGVVSISITANTTETATAALNASGSGAASYTRINIQPSGGVPVTVSGAIAGPLVDLNGADNVFINGLNTGGNALTFDNTSTGSATTCTFRYLGDAVGDTVTNCVIRGASTSATLGTILFSTGTTTGNDNNVISNCTIDSSGGVYAVNAIYVNGTATAGIENSNVSILNNNIANYFSATLSTSGITLAAGATNWNISNNRFYQTITRTYTTAAVHRGISAATGNGHLISGNTIGYASANATGLTTMTAAVAITYVAINLGVGTTQTTIVQNNKINAFSLTTTATTGTGAGVFCGVAVNTASAASNVDVVGNTFGSQAGVDSILVVSGSAGLLAGISSSSTGIVNVQNNTFGAMTNANSTAANAAALFGVFAPVVHAQINITGNTFGSAVANNMRAGVVSITTGATLVSAVNVSANSTVITILNNTMQNFSSYGTATTAYVRGVTTSATSGTGLVVVKNNTISNLTTFGALTGQTNGNTAVTGIQMGTGSNDTIAYNTIFNLFGLNTGTTNIVAAGITHGNGTNSSIFNNTIYNIQNAGTSTTATTPAAINGILIRSGVTAAKVFNNMISLGSGQTTNSAIVGIWGNHGSTPDPIDSITHNTVNISGVVASGVQPSFCYYRGDFSTTARTVPTVVLNNIFTNDRSGGTGKHYAIANNYGATATSVTGWPAGASNNNVLNAATAATLAYWGADLTFAGWKTASSCDANSVSGVTVNYVNSASDLHLSMGATPTLIESGAQTLANNRVDIDGQIRPGPIPSVNGGGANSDMGADEADLVPIGMVLDSSNTDQITGNLPLGGKNQMVLRIRLHTTYSALPLVLQSLKLRTAGTLTADIDSAKVFYTGSSSTFSTATQYGTVVAAPSAIFYVTGTQTLSNGVNYFWVTYNIKPTATANNTVDAILDSARLSGVNYAPINGDPVGNRTIKAPLAGNYNIGTGNAYTTLTAVVADLNILGVSAPTRFILTDPSYSTASGEVFPITFNAYNNSSAVNTITILPAASNTVTINGANAGPILDFNGVANITVSGRQNGNGLPKNLTIENTNTGGVAVRFINDANNIRLSNDSIKGANTAAAGGVIFFGTGILNGNDNIVIDSCNIGDGLIGTPATSIYALGSTTNTAMNNSSVTISNCNIYNFWNAATECNAFKISGGNTDWVMTGNSMYQTASRTATATFQQYVWNLNNTSANNHLITNNFIGGTAPQCGGTAYTVSGAVNVRFTGALLNVGSLVPSTFSGNTYANMNWSSGTTANTTAPGVWGAVWVQGGLVNTTDNIIGSMSANGSIVVTSNITNNFVYPIGYTSGAVGTQNIKRNSIGGITLSGTGVAISSSMTVISNTGATTVINIDSNIIGSSLANSIQLNTASTSATVQTILGISNTATTVLNSTGNTLQNFTNAYAGTGAGLTTGIVSTAGTNTIVRNTVRSFSTATPQAGTGTTASVQGISMQSTAGNALVSENKVYDLMNTSTTGATRITGIDCASNVNGTDLVSRNLVHSLNCLSVITSSAAVAGIRQISGNLRVVNNMVRLGYDTTGANTGSNVLYIGLNKGAGIMKAFYNTIYVGGTVTDTGSATSNALRLQAAGADSVFNNIFVNERSNTNSLAVGIHYAIFSTSTVGAFMNNNIYKAPGSMFAVIGSVNYATINTWRSLGMDANSAVGDPSLINPTGSAGTLNLRVASPTAVEASGASIAGIGVSVDYDGFTRATRTPNDIGAASGNFTYNDIFSPIISFTPLSNYGATTDRTFLVTLSDRSNVSAIASPPKVYFKKSMAGTYFSTTGTRVSGTVTSGTWSFTISAASVGGLALNDSIYYYIVAQDSSINNNIGSIPAGVVASNTSTITVDPLSVYAFKVVPGLGGTITVGTGGTYPSLTGTGGAFEALNASSITGNTTLSIISDLAETGAVSLNQLSETGNGLYTLSIVPDGTTERLIVGSVANGLITFNGADRVKIDGRFSGSGKYLRIRNRNTGGSTIKFLNDARRDSILYTYIEGTTTAVGAIYFTSPATGGFGNDSNVIMNCVVSDTLNNPASGAIPNTGLYSDAALNSENVISNNEFVNYTYQGINILGANNDNWIISNNSFYQTAAGTNKAGLLTSGPTQAVLINSPTSGGYLITGNSFGGSAANRSGPAYASPFTTLGVTVRVIDLTLGTLGVTTVSNNIISNWTTTVGASASGSSFIGIGVSSGLVNITGNTIGGGAAAYDTIRQSNTSVTNIGAIVLVGGIITVSNNTIGNINDIGGTLLSSNRTIGITAIGSLAGSNFNILNNTIRDIKCLNQPVAATPTTYNAMSPAGIVVTALTSVPVNIEGNTIYNMTNTFTGGANTATGINIRGGISTVHRNRMYNIGGLGTGVGANANIAYGIMVTTTGNIIRNNQIALTTTVTGEDQLFGIMDASTVAGTNNYYNNSVYIGGAASGANNSYNIIVGTVATSTIFNNIFYNTRTGGTGKHFAMGSSGASGFTAATSNYNLMVVPGLSAIAEMPTGTALNISGLNALYTSGNNSNWIDITSNVPTANLFTNAAVGDLGIVTTNAISWYANGKGLPLVSVGNDFNNTTRSTTLVGGSTDLGSVEFTTTTLPISATASAAPAVSTTTTYSFANRTVAAFTWGASGTVPTALDVKYYSGTSAPNPPNAGCKQYKSYITATPTGGTGYGYTTSIRYDSAMLGSVNSAATSRLAYYVGTIWNPILTLSGVSNGMLTTTSSLTSAAFPGNFTGTDLSAPLPVSLVKFVATAVSGDVQLDWTTASEINNAGFEVERSVNGKSFESVGFVKGAGNSSNMLSYALTDTKAFAIAGSNSLYYRLKQVDMDGTTTYSEVMNVTNEKTETISIGLYPNPATDVVTVSAIITSSGQMTITIMDLQGKRVANFVKEANVGMNTMTINSSLLNGAGIYFVKVTVNGEAKVMKLVKQ